MPKTEIHLFPSCSLHSGVMILFYCKYEICEIPSYSFNYDHGYCKAGPNYLKPRPQLWKEQFLWPSSQSETLIWCFGKFDLTSNSGIRSSVDFDSNSINGIRSSSAFGTDSRVILLNQVIKFKYSSKFYIKVPADIMNTVDSELCIFI